jgi:predicted TIM-barrel fold metal-dependent hydrolase
MGGAAWTVNGERVGGVSVQAVMPDRTENPRAWAEVPRITYVAAERVKAMDADGVDVHTLHPGLAGMLGNDPSRPQDYRLDIIRAYNDAVIEEYGDAFPGRFIVLVQVPYWDPAEAVKEFHRTLSRSREVRGVNFGFPQHFGYAHICDPTWDVLWAALQEADLPLHLHINGRAGRGFQSDVWEGRTDPMATLAEISVKGLAGRAQVAATLLFSGIFERYPGLKVVFAEGGAGWVPYLVDLADHQWERQRMANHGMPQPPHETFRAHCYANFWFEQINDEIRRQPGIANVMWLSDFPHPTATYPTSQEYIAHSLKDVTEEERQMVLVENARRLYHLPEGY